jgi:hypothetical protein
VRPPRTVLGSTTCSPRLLTREASPRSSRRTLDGTAGMIYIKNENAKVMTLMCPRFEIIGPDSGFQQLMVSTSSS